MKYSPTDLSPSDQELAKVPELGADSILKVSHQPVGIVYEIEQTGVAASQVNPAAGAYAIPGGGIDLSMVCVNGVVSDTSLVVTLDITDEDGGTGTAVATFAAPAFAGNQSHNQAIGTAVDLVVAGTPTKKIKAITGVASVTGGSTGNRFRVLALPSADSWYTVGCTRGKDLTLPVPASIAIACGRNGSAYTSTGVSEPGSMSAEAAYVTYGDGLARLGGHKVSAMIESRRADRVLTERTVIGGWVPTPNSPAGDGDDERSTTAEGNFETFATFF